MLHALWERFMLKWRGLLVYFLLDACSGPVYTALAGQAPTDGLRIFAHLASVATAIYCFSHEVLLLTTDRPGDEKWPPLWS